MPVWSVATLLGAGPPLVLGVRPGDACLGCGGIIAAAVEAEMAPFVVVLTDGAARQPGARAAMAVRQEAVAAAAALGLGADRLAFLGLPDEGSPAGGPAFDAAVATVEALAIRIGAGMVLAPCGSDAGDVHAIAARAAREAGVRHLAYPLWGTGAFGMPGGRVDVAAQWARKRLAIEAHRSRIGTQDWPGTRKAPVTFSREFEFVLEV